MRISEITKLEPQAFSDETAQRFVNVQNLKHAENPGNFKYVPVTGLPDGFFLKYSEMGSGYRYTVSLIDATDSTNPIVICSVQFAPETRDLPNGSQLSGLRVTGAATSNKYTGKGYMVYVYKTLVDHSQIIFSDMHQTPAGQKLWQKLVISNDVSAWAIIHTSTDTIYVNVTNENFDKVVDVVYSRDKNQFMLVPKSDTKTIKLLNQYSTLL